MKKYLFGSGTIAAGIGASALISGILLSMDLAMFNPDNRGSLMMQLFLIPLIVLWGSYTLWYWTQAKKRTRDMKNYSTSLVLLITVIIADAALAFGLVQLQGFLDEAWGHVILNELITGAAFCISLEKFRPW